MIHFHYFSDVAQWVKINPRNPNGRKINKRLPSANWHPSTHTHEINKWIKNRTTLYIFGVLRWNVSMRVPLKLEGVYFKLFWFSVLFPHCWQLFSPSLNTLRKNVFNYILYDQWYINLISKFKRQVRVVRLTINSISIYDKSNIGYVWLIAPKSLYNRWRKWAKLIYPWV